jgi:peptidoglycan/xylan/chitin deacetylase (PgdA/CDA1 family)
VGLLDEAEAVAGRPAAGAGRDLLGSEEILAMQSTGLVRFGSHSRRHTRLLDGLSPAQLDDELRGSRTSLESILGQPVPTFCYPNGDYSPAALALVRRTYTAAVTTRPGWNAPGSDLHQLRRMAVHEDIAADELSFLARISGLR